MKDPLSRIKRVIDSVRRFEQLKGTSEDVSWAYTHLSLLTSEYQRFRHELTEGSGRNPTGWATLTRIEELIFHAFAVGAFTEDKLTANKSLNHRRSGGKEGSKFHVKQKQKWREKALPFLQKLQPMGQVSVFSDFGLAIKLREKHGSEIAGLPSTSVPVVTFIRELVRDNVIAPSKVDLRKSRNVNSSS